MTHPAWSIRHDVFTRSPLSHAPRQPPPGRRMSRWSLRLRLLLAPLAPIASLAALIACAEHDKPRSLATSVLAGPRRVTGPVYLDEAVDVPGSMTTHTTQREQAERKPLGFARRGLGDRDLPSTVLLDDPATLDAALRRADHTRTYAVVPTGAIGWQHRGLLDSVVVHGEVLGGVTGQRRTRVATTTAVS
ncbi:hypothetical protein ACN27F_31015 [Solwaraspora sp. WMMB335]|uniref:hypothetical protein n=1 Tax=Solwaraspora sp. WMMB335 TaxID=3404118 RepID=UPI003B95F909